ncbi:MAG: hypothetical protein WBA07_28695 [Rivularia sp. (in: cyanobacteria)]
MIEYCAFDIAVAENENNTEKVHLDYGKALQLFEQVGMMAAKPLFIGKYEEAAAYNIKFESRIPAILNLPPLQQPKPVKSIYIETRKGRIRPISKFVRVTNQEIEKINQLVDFLKKDVLESFNEEYETIFNAFSVENQNDIMVKLNKASQKLVDDYFK